MLHVNHVLRLLIMKTNVALKLDADLLREARVVAAEEGARSARFCPIGWKRSFASGRHSTRPADVLWPASGKASTSSGHRPSRATSSMSDRDFVDTNVLMYAEPDEPTTAAFRCQTRYMTS